MTLDKLKEQNVYLQSELFNIRWNIFTVIELLEKGNNKKALKLLKKVLYE